MLQDAADAFLDDMIWPAPPNESIETHGLRAQPAGVVASGDQQRAGGVGANPERRRQPGRCSAGEPVQLGVQGSELAREDLVAGQDPHASMGDAADGRAAALCACGKAWCRCQDDLAIASIGRLARSVVF
jgi:hypothetical protein